MVNITSVHERLHEGGLIVRTGGFLRSVFFQIQERGSIGRLEKRQRISSGMSGVGSDSQGSPWGVLMKPIVTTSCQEGSKLIPSEERKR